MPVPRSTCQRPANSSVGAAAQVVDDAVQVGAAIAQQATGGDSDDAQPGLLDDIIGVAALREFTADMGVQRPVVGRAQLRDIRRFDRRGHGAGDNWEREQPAAARAAATPYSKRESFASMDARRGMRGRLRGQRGRKSQWICRASVGL